MCSAQPVFISMASEVLQRVDADVVTLTCGLTQERRQSGFQGSWGEESAEKNQPMQPAFVSSSGEDPPKRSSRERWRQQRRLLRKVSITSSGDPTKDALVAKIRSFQSSGGEERFAWESFCHCQMGHRDPVQYPVDVLQLFVSNHCTSGDAAAGTKGSNRIARRHRSWNLPWIVPECTDVPECRMQKVSILKYM